MGCRSPARSRTGDLAKRSSDSNRNSKAPSRTWRQLGDRQGCGGAQQAGRHRILVPRARSSHNGQPVRKLGAVTESTRYSIRGVRHARVDRGPTLSLGTAGGVGCAGCGSRTTLRPTPRPRRDGRRRWIGSSAHQMFRTRPPRRVDSDELRHDRVPETAGRSSESAARRGPIRESSSRWASARAFRRCSPSSVSVTRTTR